ncbi:MAG TPA: polysaccharide biosynthesis tyrosine autokinase [Sphingomicrobium sp.]|nr:polysaccharide biosynthesis tyrosine autokinase [Sphingomicrobium sp.]
MGNDVALTPADRQALVDPFAPTRGHGLHWQERNQADRALDFAALVRILLEYRWLIAGAAALGLLLGVLAALMTTPLYRADVTLEVNAPGVEILDEQRRESSTYQTTWDLVTTQAGLLSSRSLAERVAQDLNLAANPEFVGTEGDAASRLRAAADLVQAGLVVEVPEEGQLIKFSYVSESPELAARIANGIADGFIDSSLQRRYDASAYARKFLQQQIAKTRSALERSERQLVAYAQQEGIINTATGQPGQPAGDAASIQGESLIALNRALAEATAKRVAAEGAYRSASLAGALDASENTQPLRQSRAALEAEYQDKRTLMKPDHPDMLSLRSRIEELDRQISREGAAAAGGRASSLQAEYLAAASAERALQGRVAALKGSVLNLRGRSIRYNILQRDVDTNRGLYDALLQRYKEIGVAGGVGASPVSIVDRANVPGGPFKPNLPINLFVGLGLGLVAGVGGALALEFLHDTIKTREDVRTKLQLACLGVVPRRRGKGNVVEELKDPSSSVSEAYAAVLASLRFSTEHGAPKILLITSTEAAEGKSSSAFALAQNYSRRGESVLLIDADLRRPAFRGASNRQGLTKLLTNDEPIRGHILETQFESLWLLPCGPTPPNPADLLSTGRFNEIVKEAAEHFDRIVIDGPPVLGLADASLLAVVAGSVMMVVESGRTKTRLARDAIERIQASGAHIVGVVLTKSGDEASQYGYRLYQYGYKQVDDKRNEIVMIQHQPEG